MKAKKLLLIPLAALLASCSQGISSSIESSQGISLSEITTSEVSISQDKDSSSLQASTSERDYPVDDWSTSTKANIQLALGDVEIPFYKTREQESETGIQNSTTYVRITCKNVNADSAEANYCSILQNQGYTVTSDDENYIAYKSISVTDDVVIQFALQDGDLVIYAYTYQCRYTSWPSEGIKSVLDYDVPKATASAYEYGTSIATNGNTLIYFYCYDVEEGYIDTYIDSLKKDGYTISSMSSDIYYATNSTKQIQMTVYSYSDSVLYISMYSTKVITYFPSSEVEEILGEKIPVCSFDGVEYEVKVITTSTNYTIYTIYCDNASSVDNYNSYVKAMVDAGWTLKEQELPSTESNYYTSILKKNENEKTEHMIQVIYSPTYASIAIGIYY